jgi:tRNA pseudouridine38-40 synthase
MRYFIQLSYKGTNYCGWQIQPNAPSVQKEINKCLSVLLGKEINSVGAGRTDTGVHAKEMFAHFDTDKEIEQESVMHRLNKFLPKDIVIHRLYQVNNDAHARFDAIHRTYEYIISKGKNAFLQDSSWLCYAPLDIALMNKASKMMFDYVDFSSFAKIHTDVKTHICKLMVAEWTEDETTYKFTVRADRFLRNMVRAMVGTLVDIGKGKMSPEEIKKILEQMDRGVASASAPAEGLFLIEVAYPNTIMHV